VTAMDRVAHPIAHRHAVFVRAAIALRAVLVRAVIALRAVISLCAVTAVAPSFALRAVVALRRHRPSHSGRTHCHGCTCHASRPRCSKVSSPPWSTPLGWPISLAWLASLGWPASLHISRPRWTGWPHSRTNLAALLSTPHHFPGRPPALAGPAAVS